MKQPALIPAQTTDLSAFLMNHLISIGEEPVLVPSKDGGDPLIVLGLKSKAEKYCWGFHDCDCFIRICQFGKDCVTRLNVDTGGWVYGVRRRTLVVDRKGVTPVSLQKLARYAVEVKTKVRAIAKEKADREALRDSAMKRLESCKRSVGIVEFKHIHVREVDGLFSVVLEDNVGPFAACQIERYLDTIL